MGGTPLTRSTGRILANEHSAILVTDSARCQLTGARTTDFVCYRLLHRRPNAREGEADVRGVRKDSQATACVD